MSIFEASTDCFLVMLCHSKNMLCTPFFKFFHRGFKNGDSFNLPALFTRTLLVSFFFKNHPTGHNSAKIDKSKEKLRYLNVPMPQWAKYFLTGPTLVPSLAN